MNVIHKRIPQPVQTTLYFIPYWQLQEFSVNMVWGEVLETQLYSLINEVQAVMGKQFRWRSRLSVKLMRRWMQ
jgi:hypothetical protein